MQLRKSSEREIIESGDVFAIMARNQRKHIATSVVPHAPSGT